MDAPWGVCAIERQYRDRRTSRRLDHPKEGSSMDEEVAWYVGVDWASAAHHVRLVDAKGTARGERVVAHDGAALAALADWLLRTSGAPARQIHVAIEVPHGPVVESLLERGLRVYSINPKQLDRFRDRFSPAGAKDDSRDAEVLASALRTDRRCFRELTALDPVVVELREWSRIAEELTRERVRLANRVREQLWRYYPQMLELDDDLAAPWLLALWRLAPTPDKAARLRATTLQRLLKQYRIRRFDVAQVLACLKRPALSVAPGTTEAASAHVALLAKQLDLVNRQIAEANDRLDRLTDRLAAAEGDGAGQPTEQRDVTILRSLPGVGRIVLATLLAEASHPLQHRDYHALRCLAGAAPVTRRSGKSMLVLMRRAVNDRLRNALYHWARIAVQRDHRSKLKYAALRARGHSHARALRSVGDRLLASACAMLKTGTLFDPDRARHPADSPA
jgi:transposase